MGPPVVLGDEEAGFEDAGVTCSGGIVVQGGYSPSKGVVCHDDEMGAIPPGTVGVLLQRIGVGPLGKEGGVGGLGGEKGGVKISGGHSAKKQGVRQGEDTVVVIDASVMIGAAREGVGAVGSARLVEEADVVVAECQDVASEAAIDFLGTAIILEILVISENVDDEFGTEEEVAPMFKGTDDGEEFAVPDWVISFGLGEGRGVISHGML